LICGTPPGPGEINLGVSNFSYEFWTARKVITFYPEPPYWTTGFCEISGPFLLAEANFFAAATPPWAIAWYRNPPGPALAEVQVLNVDVTKWVHVALNYDRAANLEIYLNGVLSDTDPIDANDMGTSCFFAHSLSRNGPGNCSDDRNDITSFAPAHVVIGPIAMHMRLLTPAEIRDSVRGKRVQNFGTPNTRICWDWRLIERLDGNPVDWDFDDTHITDAFWVGLDGRAMGSPLGAAGTVRIPDLSGSNNHLVLPTQLAYGPAVADRSSSTFLCDPFWMN